MSSIKITNISNRAGDSGATVSGVSTALGTGSTKLPSGTSGERVGIESGSLRYNSTDNTLEFYNGTSWLTISSVNRDEPFYRGVFGGGTPGPSNVLDYITIATTGNATDFGDLTVARGNLAACSSSTRGVFGGGYSPTTNTIDYITIATTGNATDFGDLTVTRAQFAACSNSTRGVFGGGGTGGGENPSYNILDYITIATTGNAIDFGDLSIQRRGAAACSSSTRGVFGGGYNYAVPASYLQSIDYITIGTTGNALNFGNLSAAVQRFAACSSSTRGVFGGGQLFPGAPSTNTIDYITIATTGNSTDFGDLTVVRRYLSACSSSTRGVFGGGTPAGANTIDYITIATTGDATDFGDLTVARSSLAACSNNHGGLS